MARPKIPLISRRKALAAALEIIDNEGLDALSIRRLADKLGVNGASLYHHFANKEDIVIGAAELALADVRTPDASDESWHTWLPRNSRIFRAAIIAHPELVPVIVRRRELGLGARMLDSSAARMVEEGVPIGAVMPMLDAGEMLALGSAIHATRGETDPDDPRLGGLSMLNSATKLRVLTSDEVFENMNVSILLAVEQAAMAKAKSPAKAAPAKSPAKAAPAKVAKAVAKRSTHKPTRKAAPRR